MVTITYKLKDASTGTIYQETQDREFAMAAKIRMESQGKACMIEEEKSYMEVQGQPRGMYQHG